MHQIEIIENDEQLRGLISLIEGLEEKIIGLDIETVGHVSYGFWMEASALQNLSQLVKVKSDGLAVIIDGQEDKKYRKRLEKARKCLERYQKKTATKIRKLNEAAIQSKSGLHFWNNAIGSIQICLYTPTVISFHLRPQNVSTDLLHQVFQATEKILIHHAQFEYKMIKQHLGIELAWQKIVDTMIWEYVLENGRPASKATSLKDTAYRRLGIELDKNKAIRVSNWLGTWSDEQIQYAAEDVVHLLDIHRQQLASLPKDAAGTLRALELEHRLIPAVVEMEMNGIPVDKQALRAIREPIVRLQTEFYNQFMAQVEAFVWVDFNLDSPAQLLSVLNTASGLRLEDTNATTLKAYGGNPLIAALLEYRKYTKLLGTYIDPYIKMDTDVIYADFKPQSTDTARFASANPNLQNQPAHPIEYEEDGEKRQIIFRNIYKAPPGWRMVVADLSQIELRFAAEISQDPALIEAFNSGEDVHKATASLAFNIPLEEVTKELRFNAKAVNFGVIYGKTVWGLMKQLNVTEVRANWILNRYFMAYSKLKKMIANAKADAKKNGYAKSLMGRIRWLPDINSEDKCTRQACERQAVNTIIQMSAGDHNKKALVRLYERLKRMRLLRDIRLCLTVHDEVVLLVRDDPQILVIAKKVLKEALISSGQQFIKSIPVMIGDEGNGWDCLEVTAWGEAK